MNTPSSALPQKRPAAASVAGHSRTNWRRYVVFLIAGIVAVASLWFGGRAWLARTQEPELVVSGEQAAVGANESETQLVTLTETQREAAGLHAVAIGVHPMQEVRRIPGRIGYDENQYLPITSPVRGIVRTVNVLPGQQVQQGTVLAVVSSAEIGSARSEVMLKQQQLELATQRYQWDDQIYANVQSLLDQLASRPKIESVEQAFAGKLLGDHRSKMLTAYANLLLAENTATRTDPLAEQGVVSGRIVQQRRTDREVAAAEFQSVCEQTRLSVQEERARAETELNDARRRLAVSEQHLVALCGSQMKENAVEETAWNDLELKAPISGQVVRKEVVPASRVDVADPLFVLADTNSLWVSAQLREQDWETLRTAVGQPVQLQVPAVEGATYTATVRFVGSEVSETTRALPLVAELENTDVLLKPGLFAWMALPIGPVRECLAVPSAAIQRHEGKTFVFVELRPGSYRRQDVQIGLETLEWTEIVGGLQVGQQVVDEGAFCLKSELLLVGEE